MVGGGGTTATIQHNIRYDSTTPTGGWDLYDRVSYAYYTSPKEEKPDPRKDPKMWKLWFKEFLQEIFGKFPEEIISPKIEFVPTRIFHRCRSGTVPTREWKMKNWIQALA
jgi:hypothetical protein